MFRDLKKSRVQLYGSAMAAIMAATHPAYAFLDDIFQGAVEIVGDVGEAALETTGLPTIGRIIEGQTVDEALENGLENVVEGVQAGAAAPAVLQPFHSATSDAIRDIAGDVAADIHDVSNFPARVAENHPRATVDWVIATTENIENAQHVIGIPLAAALQQAYDHYDPVAQPLPVTVRRMLELGGFPDEVLNQARYMVDSDPGALNGLINNLQTSIGDTSGGNHAVVTGNIIVFAQEPAHNDDDFHFWAHEVTHVEQYARWGIVEFASRYITDFGGIEQEADDRAEAAFETYVAELLLILELTGDS